MDAEFLKAFTSSREAWSSSVNQWQTQNSENLKKQKEKERRDKVNQKPKEQQLPQLPIPTINYDFTQSKHGGYSFGKLERTKHSSSTSTLATVKDLEETPNIAVVRRTKPAYSFAKVTQPNEKLKQKRKVAEQLEKAQSEVEKQKSADAFKLTKERVSGGYIAPKKEVSEKQRFRTAMSQLGQKVKAEPGKYEPAQDKIMHRQLDSWNRAPAYSIREKPKKKEKVELEDVKRAPGRYNAKEELLHPHVPEITIPKEKKEKEIELDMRKGLDVKIDLTRKRVPVVYIEPEHEAGETEIMRQFNEMKLGPGKYEISHKLTEKQDSAQLLVDRMLGMQQCVSNHIHPRKLKICDFHYFRIMTSISLTKGVLQPQHPENTEPKGYLENHWRYYDLNINAVKEKGAVHDFASNLSQPEFQTKDIEKKEWEMFKLRTQGVPGVGRYDPKTVEPEPTGFDFGKMKGRQNTSEIERELGLESYEGDALDLNPEKLKAKVPGFTMQKMQGRQDVRDIERELELDQEPVLDLRINHDFSKKKTPMFVNMDRQMGRREVWEGQDAEGDNILLPSRSTMEAGTRKKNSAYYDMGRMSERFKLSSQEYEIDGDNQIINPEKKPWRENRGAKWGNQYRFEPLDLVEQEGLNDLAYTLKLTVNLEATEPKPRAHLFPKEKRFKE